MKVTRKTTYTIELDEDQASDLDTIVRAYLRYEDACSDTAEALAKALLDVGVQ